MNFRDNPQLSQVVPGQYFEIVHKEYSPSERQTYAVFARYGIDLPGQSPYILFLQPRPFSGQPTDQDMLKTVEHVESVSVVGLK